MITCTYIHTYMHTQNCHNLAPSSKLHASLVTPRGHSTLWPVGQQAVQLISGEPPLFKERHMVNNTVTSQQTTSTVSSQKRLCRGTINLFVITSVSTREVCYQSGYWLQLQLQSLKNAWWKWPCSSLSKIHKMWANSLNYFTSGLSEKNFPNYVTHITNMTHQILKP